MDNFKTSNIMKKHYLLIVAIFIATQMLKAAYSLPGTGTANDPYLISTLSQLKEVSDSVNSDATVSPYKFRDKYYKVIANIDMLNVDWTPIGKSATSPFLGNFDGNNKIITNLRIGTSTTPSTNQFAGFFGLVNSGAVVKNVILEHIMYNTKSELASDMVSAAICAQAANSATIQNCHVSGSIKLVFKGIAPTSGSTGNMIVGGIAGKVNFAANIPTTIINCSSNLNIIALDSTSLVNNSGTNNDCVGGIVGNGVVTGAAFRPEIINCYSVGTIYAESNTKDIGVGGVIGRNSPALECCYSGTNITVKTTTSNINAAGAVGIRGGTLNYAIALNDFVKVITTSGTINSIFRVFNDNLSGTNLYASEAMKLWKVVDGIETNVSQIQEANYGTTKIMGENLGTTKPEDLLNTYVNDFVRVRGIDLLKWTVTAGTNNNKPIFQNTYLPQATTVKQLKINGVKVYSGVGKLVLEGETNNVQISVYNTTGQLVWNAKKTNERMEINLAKGIYLVQGIGKVIVY